MSTFNLVILAVSERKTDSDVKEAPRKTISIRNSIKWHKGKIKIYSSGNESKSFDVLFALVLIPLPGIHMWVVSQTSVGRAVTDSPSSYDPKTAAPGCLLWPDSLNKIPEGHQEKDSMNLSWDI